MTTSHLSASPCPAHLSRRRLLELGGVAMVGLGLPELLQSKATAAPYGQLSGKAKSCIFIVQYGGGSHHDTFDPRPDAPREIRGYYQPIPTNVPGIQISQKLPRLAAMADKYCLVRSMTHGNGGHFDGLHTCLAGTSNNSFTDDTPYFGSMLARLRPSVKNIPSYVWVQNLAGDVGLRYETGGSLGSVYSPLRVGKDLENPSQKDFRFRGFDPAAGLATDRMGERFRLLEQLDPASAARSSAKLAGVREFQSRALELVTGPDARRAFDLTQEPDRVRERYGWHPLGQNLLM